MERNMRLLVDAHVFDGKYQGTCTYIQGIYRELIKEKNIDFYFVAKDIGRLKKILGERENVCYIQLKHSGSIIRLLWEFPCIIKKYKIDYAHFQYISPLIKCCKEIVTIHDVLFMDFPQYFTLEYRLLNKLLFSRSARRADLLLTVSEYSKQKIAQHFNIEKSDIIVTPNAVLKEECEAVDVKTKYGLRRFILSVSRIEPRKNQIILLKAYHQLELYKKGWDLVLVGVYDMKSPDFDRYLYNLPEDEKKYIKIISVPFQDLVSLYRETDLFIFSSFAEGFGIPPLEAIKYGCKNVLCSNSTAMKDFDFFEHDLFDPHDYEELERKIVLRLNSKSYNTSLLTKIEDRYNWKKSANILYKKLHTKMK